MNWNKSETQCLVTAILSLKNKNEAQRFLRDLMTEGEIEEFGRRLAVAKMLTEKIPYTEIEEKTGMSSTTIARIAKWLKGEEGGYRAVIGRLHHHQNQTQSGRGLS